LVLQPASLVKKGKVKRQWEALDTWNEIIRNTEESNVYNAKEVCI